MTGYWILTGVAALATLGAVLAARAGRKAEFRQKRKGEQGNPESWADNLPGVQRALREHRKHKAG